MGLSYTFIFHTNHGSFHTIGSNVSYCMRYPIIQRHCMFILSAGIVHTNTPDDFIPRGVTRSIRRPIPGKLMRRVLSEERGECCSPRPGCGYSRATRRGTSHPLNCKRFQPSQSTDPLQPAFALGSPVGVGIEGLAGEVESSCSHPREAMNLFR